ncbi:DNA-3-methyladenine glycosylase [Stieleria varia]|uniref:Putative 3-methyladenine DNA glycosylase n=1 Tax=Stieleria varia TaxID=2528005 RepID=A0A5C5ZYM4_9BACT|nr:DNA-3-methyladenine glycosylase [Stieleria varia]TWT92379.1 3-methyladenine DNA glycosylase [Stieleria varia]
MKDFISKGQRLDAEFYNDSPESVARRLIGAALLRCVDGMWLGGWIVETEAYLSARDPASHSARGKTAGNASMFGPPGTLYVYPIHAKYCMNAVTENEGVGSAVLIRAIEPAWGIEQIIQHRNQTHPRRLTSGPAMICQALCVDRRDDGKDLTQDDDILILAAVDETQRRIRACKRIGISKAKDRRLRFVDRDSAYLSRPVET